MKSYWQESKKYDVLIRGGGITGLSLAYWINQIRPSYSVAIYEKENIGYGASGRNAGFLTCGSISYFSQLLEKYSVEKSKEIWDFYAENHKMLKSLLLDCDYEQNGAITYSSSFEKTKKLEETMEIMTGLGIEVEKTKENYNFHQGFLYKGDGSVNPVKLLKNIKKQIKADFFFGAQTVEGNLVLEATNAYTSSFPNLITPQRAQVLLLSPSPRFLKSTVYHPESLTYFRQLPSGHFLIGGARTLDEKNEQTKDLAINLKIQNYLEVFLKTSFPMLKDQIVEKQWSGIMAFTQDHQPIGGKVSEGHYFLGGYSGHGMGMAFHSSKKLIEHIFESKDLPWFLCLSRF